MRHFFLVICSLIFSLVVLECLSGCLGSDVKKLGASLNPSISKNTNTSDPFAVNFVFRDSSITTNRVVQITGPTNLPSANYQNSCGIGGSGCTCNFYMSTSDNSPVPASTVSFSPTNNTLTCTIAGAVAASNYTYVRIIKINSSIISGFLNITGNLTLQQVLGSSALTPSAVRKIYSYDCTRTFLEGEGVTPTSLTCVKSQQLGFIYAIYTLYLYESLSGLDSNISSKGGDQFYSNNICGYNASLPQVSCSGSPLIVQYGLYPRIAGQFKEAVTLTSSFSTNTVPTTGFAALPDSSGNCPVGLVKIRPYLAQPSSIFKNSLGTNPPSSFINSNNTLNNYKLALASMTPSDFLVTRTPNQSPCSAIIDPKTNNYLCTNATVAGPNSAEVASYSAQTPILCAIPANLM